MPNHDKQQKQVNINTALDYRLAGLSYRNIAKKMNINSTSAFNYVKAAIKIIQEKYTEKADALVSMELQKLNKMEVALYKLSIEGNTQSITALLKIQERRSRLLGLDAPIKQHTTIDTPEPIQFVLGVDESEKSK